MSFKNHSLIPVWLCVVPLIILLTTGCVISPRRTFGQGATPTPTPTPSASPTPTPGAPTPTPTPGASVGGKLYVSNSNGNSILRFDGAFTASGNVAPAATITGASTTLANPAFITLDVSADRLYVANSSGPSILVFDSISTKDGNVAPDRTISGPDLVVPIDAVVDTSQDLLYVADAVDVFVYTSASTADGTNIPATHDIATPISTAIGGICIDAAHDRLFVSDPNGNAIEIFDNASTLDGNITPNRIIQGTATHLALPSSLQLDGLGRLIVSNSSASGPSITIYAANVTNTGTGAINAISVGEIKGTNTGFDTPDQIAVDTSGNGTVYNVDSGAARVAAFANLSTATGNIAPTRTISGTSTGMSGASRPEGVAIDNSR